MTISSSSLFRPGMPIDLWHFELKPLLLLGSYYKSAYKWEIGRLYAVGRRPSKDYQGQVSREEVVAQQLLMVNPS
jgi:hypothetical protein